MIILTDSPQWIQDLPMCLKKCSGTWTEIDRGIQDPFEQELWRELGTGDRLWRGQVDIEGPKDFWDILVVVDEAARSQFDVLKHMSSTRRKWPANVASLALVGRGFHGHHGRSWHADRGNLHLSTSCQVDLDARSCGLSLTALPAVAIIKALAERGNWATVPGIKWVNDIQMAGHKVAGVLAATQSLRHTLTCLTLGIGLNVNQVPADFVPDRFVPATGCLADFYEGEAALTVGGILESILDKLADYLMKITVAGCEPLLAEYRKYSLVVGRRIMIVEDSAGTENEPELLAEGLVTAIGPDLSLTLEGYREPFSRGRLILEEPELDSKLLMKKSDS